MARCQSAGTQLSTTTPSWQSGMSNSLTRVTTDAEPAILMVPKIMLYKLTFKVSCLYESLLLFTVQFLLKYYCHIFRCQVGDKCQITVTHGVSGIWWMIQGVCGDKIRWYTHTYHACLWPRYNERSRAIGPSIESDLKYILECGQWSAKLEHFPLH